MAPHAELQAALQIGSSRFGAPADAIFFSCDFLFFSFAFFVLFYVVGFSFIFRAAVLVVSTLSNVASIGLFVFLPNFCYYSQKVISSFLDRRWRFFFY